MLYNQSGAPKIDGILQDQVWKTDMNQRRSRKWGHRNQLSCCWAKVRKTADSLRDWVTQSRSSPERTFWLAQLQFGELAPLMLTVGETPTLTINEAVSKEDIQMAKRHMKRCPAPLIIREKQIETTMRYHCSLVRIVIIRKSTNIKHWRGCGETNAPTLLIGM